MTVQPNSFFSQSTHLFRISERSEKKTLLDNKVESVAGQLKIEIPIKKFSVTKTPDSTPTTGKIANIAYRLFT